MNERDREGADVVRARIACGAHDRRAFRAALVGVPPRDRDAWMDRVLGLETLPDDGPELPRDGVPYLPCPVDAVLRAVDGASVRASDVFVDVGAGIGRAALIAHLLTGADAVGVEVQSNLVRLARDLSARLGLSGVAFVQGDAAVTVAALVTGSVFFLYCPFSGARLARTIDALEPIARLHEVRICCVDLPLPARPWLSPEPPAQGDLAIYRTTLARAVATDRVLD